jgi:hypothetical protein
MSMSVKTVRMSFRVSKYGDGFIGVGCFYRFVSSGFHQIYRMKPTKELVFND